MLFRSNLYGFYENMQAEVLVVVEDAIVRRLGQHLPFVHVRPCNRNQKDFDPREVKGLKALFPRLQAAGRLRI